MSLFATLAAFAMLAFAMTLVGGGLPLASRGLSRTGLWRFLALGSGILLSVTFMEILPEALEGGHAAAGWGLTAAFLLLFGLESYAMMHSCQEYLEECPVHIVGWAALLAMGLHSLLDGLNLAISFQAGGSAGPSVGGALSLHKFADGLTLTSLFLESRYSRLRSWLWCLALAVVTPVGALAAHFFLAGVSPAALSAMLGFAGGCFLYIASADVLPRIHRGNDRVTLVLFAAGLLLAPVLVGKGP